MEKKQITIRLPAELLQQLKREAQMRGYPTKDLVMFILFEWIESYYKRPVPLK